jgi:hypothetical protein
MTNSFNDLAERVYKQMPQAHRGVFQLADESLVVFFNDGAILGEKEVEYFKAFADSELVKLLGEGRSGDGNSRVLVYRLGDEVDAVFRQTFAVEAFTQDVWQAWRTAAGPRVDAGYELRQRRIAASITPPT